MKSRRREVTSKAPVKTKPAQENCYEMALRLGLIGLVKNGPRDLSTNLRHFRGFGK